MPQSCVCGGGEITISDRSCPVCDGTPVVYQDSFGGYVSTGFCGNCGNAWQDGELLNQSYDDRERIKKWVRKIAQNGNSAPGGSP
jgi:hypothetical protein